MKINALGLGAATLMAVVLTAGVTIACGDRSGGHHGHGGGDGHNGGGNGSCAAVPCPDGQIINGVMYTYDPATCVCDGTVL